MLKYVNSDKNDEQESTDVNDSLRATDAFDDYTNANVRKNDITFKNPLYRPVYTVPKGGTKNKGHQSSTGPNYFRPVDDPMARQIKHAGKGAFLIGVTELEEKRCPMNDPDPIRRQRLKSFKIETAPGVEDQVRCFGCDGGLRQWDAGDDPWIEHCRWFPACPFARRTKGDLAQVGAFVEQGENVSELEVTIPELEKHRSMCTEVLGFLAEEFEEAFLQLQKSGKIIPTLEEFIFCMLDIQKRNEIRQFQMKSVAVDTRETTYRRPEYARYEARLATFDGWSEEITHQLTDAGFYSTGVADQVRCFACDGELRQWGARDDPWVEHCRCFPACPFARGVKGDQYIAHIQASVDQGEDISDPIKTNMPAVGRVQYRCRRCDKVGRRYQVVAHILKVHVPIERVPFFCTRCLFRCQDPGTLLSHSERCIGHKHKVKKNGPTVDLNDSSRASSNPWFVTDKDMIVLDNEMRWPPVASGDDFDNPSALGVADAYVEHPYGIEDHCMMSTGQAERYPAQVSRYYMGQTNQAKKPKAKIRVPSPVIRTERVDLMGMSLPAFQTDADIPRSPMVQPEVPLKVTPILSNPENQRKQKAADPAPTPSLHEGSTELAYVMPTLQALTDPLLGSTLNCQENQGDKIEKPTQLYEAITSMEKNIIAAIETQTATFLSGLEKLCKALDERTKENTKDLCSIKRKVDYLEQRITEKENF